MTSANVSTLATSSREEDEGEEVNEEEGDDEGDDEGANDEERADSHEDIEYARDGFTAMELAAMYGHAKVVEEFTHKVFPYEGSNVKGINPLHLAAKYGYTDIVQTLTSYYEDEDVGENGNSVGHYAAKNGHDKLFVFLARHRAAKCYVGTANRQGLNVLHFAAKNGHEKIVDLIAGNGDLSSLFEAVDSLGKTSLHYAAESGHDQIVAKLIHRNPRLISKPTKDGWTALHLAAECGHDSIVARLLTYAPELRDVKDLAGRTALQLATESGVAALVAPLLTQNLKSIPVLDSSGKSILHIAVKTGSWPIIEQVLARRPGLIDVADSNGKTALYYAVMSAEPIIVAELLVRRPAVVDGRHLWACLKNRESGWVIMDLLLAARPELAFCVDKNGNTALHRLVENTVNENVVRKLLEMNPLAVHTCNTDGATPFNLAVRAEMDGLMDVLQWKLSLDDIVRAQIDQKAARSHVRPFVELQYQTLSMFVHEDVKKLITDYLWYEEPDFMAAFLRSVSKKRKSMDDSESDILDDDDSA